MRLAVIPPEPSAGGSGFRPTVKSREPEVKSIDPEVKSLDPEVKSLGPEVSDAAPALPEPAPPPETSLVGGHSGTPSCYLYCVASRFCWASSTIFVSSFTWRVFSSLSHTLPEKSLSA